MTLLAESTVQSPLVVTLVGVLAAALLALAGAALKLVVQLAQMKTELTAIGTALAKMEKDPDIMRWSNYGRAVQAFNQAPTSPGGHP